MICQWSHQSAVDVFYIFKCCLKLFVALLVWRETNFEIYHRSYRPGWKWRTITWLQSHTRLIHDEMCDRLHPLSVLKTTLACCGHIPNKNIWSYSIHIHFYVQHIYHIQLVKLFIMLSNFWFALVFLTFINCKWVFTR